MHSNYFVALNNRLENSNELPISHYLCTTTRRLLTAAERRTRSKANYGPWRLPRTSPARGRFGFTAVEYKSPRAYSCVRVTAITANGTKATNAREDNQLGRTWIRFRIVLRTWKAHGCRGVKITRTREMLTRNATEHRWFLIFSQHAYTLRLDRLSVQNRKCIIR